MVHYNVLIWGARQPGWSPADVDTPPLPVTRRYPVSDGSPHRRMPLTVSLLLHAAVACSVAIWLRHRPPASHGTEQPVEMVFQPSPAETAQEPPQQAAPMSPEPLPPAPPQPAETTPSPAPSPPPVAAAPEVPSSPAPAPLVVEQPDEAPRLPPPPMSRPARPRPRPTAHARPAEQQPAPLAVPASPSPAPASPPPMEAPPAPINSAWRQQLAAWLAAHKTYPEEARRRGDEGSVTLRFSVERSGRVARIMVVHGSGSSILDGAAEAMLRNATLPPFPTTMSEDRVGVTVQVRFALTN
jgi:protein TonB